MVKSNLYVYSPVGDLCHCNNCDTDVLIPTGEDICPYCHFDGGMQWITDDNEKSISNKEIIDNFNIIRMDK